MEQETQTKQKNKFGVIMLLSAFILGLAFLVLNLSANNSRNPVQTSKPEPQKAAVTEKPVVKEYPEIKETSNTPEEINNEVLDELDNDMKNIENSQDDISDLEL